MTAFKKTIASALVVASLSSPLKAYASPDAEYAGAILGGIAGGIAGHQFGKGEGNVVSTIGGAALGVIVGLLVGRELSRPSVRQLPDINLDRLKERGNYHMRADDIFVHVYYVREMQALRPGFTECMQYDVYARVDGRRGRTRTLYACSNGRDWIDVTEKDVGVIINRGPVVQPLPPPMPAPVPVPPPQQYLTPFTGDEFTWVDRDISGAGDEGNKLRFLDFHLRDFARRGRGLTANQANYLLRHFVVQSDTARNIMTPFVIQ